MRRTIVNNPEHASRFVVGSLSHDLVNKPIEGCYAGTKEALLPVYRWVHPVFGVLFGPMIICWMNLFYDNALDKISPARLAPDLQMPVLLVHGEKDRRFPLSFAEKLHRSFKPGQAELFVAEGAGHSDSSLATAYPGAVRRFLQRNGLKAEA